MRNTNISIDKVYFDETYINVFLHPSFWHLVLIFVVRQVITLKLIKLMTHLLLKKRCRDVNKQRNTNKMLLLLLFTIKRSLSISLKRSVYLNIIKICKWYQTTRYYEMLRSTASVTTRYCEIQQEVLRVTTRYYKWY